MIAFVGFHPGWRIPSRLSRLSGPAAASPQGRAAPGDKQLQATDISRPAYFHKVVDCQWACPAHTPVPEYIRLIGQGRYDDAYMINWVSNVFPGILGRTCDRPCEPACRRSRVEENNGAAPEPVAICRLKRVAADYKNDVKARMPAIGKSNGKRIACIGAGPSSLTVARDLAPLGYEVTVFDGEAKAGGFIRTQIPRFRLPESVIDEETGYILDLGVKFHSGRRVDSMKALLAEGYDAVFVGCGAPRGRDLDAPGRKEAAAGIHIGIDWLASVSFGHITEVGERVIVLGGGNTAMDCCRSARRGRTPCSSRRRPSSTQRCSSGCSGTTRTRRMTTPSRHRPRPSGPSRRSTRPWRSRRSSGRSTTTATWATLPSSSTMTARATCSTRAMRTRRSRC